MYLGEIGSFRSYSGATQIMADGMRINYNFIRPHMGLDGRTPAQTAGLDLGLAGIRWKELIKQATRAKT